MVIVLAQPSLLSFITISITINWMHGCIGCHHFDLDDGVLGEHGQPGQGGVVEGAGGVGGEAV